MSELDEEKKKNKITANETRTKNVKNDWKSSKSLLSRVGWLVEWVEYPCNILRASRVHDLCTLPFNDFPQDIKGKWQVDIFQGLRIKLPMESESIKARAIKCEQIKSNIQYLKLTIEIKSEFVYKTAQIH